jgi:hypothetical protein
LTTYLLDIEGAEELVMQRFPLIDTRSMYCRLMTHKLRLVCQSGMTTILLKQLKPMGRDCLRSSGGKATLDKSAFDIDTENHKY